MKTHLDSYEKKPSNGFKALSALNGNALKALSGNALG